MNRYEFENHIQKIFIMRNQAVKEFASMLQKQAQKRNDSYISDVPESENTFCWKLDILLLSFLQAVQLSPNPRSVNNLERTVEVFNSKNEGANIILNDLIHDGWIRTVWNRWYLPHNFSFSHYKEFADNDSLFAFLTELKNTSFPDQRTLEVVGFSDILNNHRRRYPNTPNEEWFIDNAIIKNTPTVAGFTFTLDRHSKYLQMHSLRLCSQLWEDYSAGPLDNLKRLSWWYERTDFLRYSYDFLTYMSAYPRNNFLDACLNQILCEKDLLDWEWEKRKLNTEHATMNGRLKVDQEIISWLPTFNSEAERLFQHENPRLDSSLFVDDARLSYRFLIKCIFIGESLDIGNSMKRERFWDLMEGLPERPFIYRVLTMECTQYFPELIAHLISKKHTALIGTLLLSKFIMSETVESAESLWNEGLALVGANLKGMDDDTEACHFIIEVLSWLIKQYRRHSLNVTRSEGLQHRRAQQYKSFYEMLLTMRRYNNTQESFASSIFPTIFKLIKSELDDIKSQFESPHLDIILWLCSKVSSECPSISDGLYRYLFTTYRKLFRTDLTSLLPNTESYAIHEGWISAGLYMYNHHQSEWTSTLSIANGTLSDDPSPANVRRQKIRIHLRWLANLACNISEVKVLHDIADALGLCFRAFQQDDFLEDTTIDAFSWLVEANVLQSIPTDIEPLLVMLTNAIINKFPDNERSCILKAFAESTNDARRLAIIFNHLANPADQEIIENRLLYVTSDALSTHTITEVQIIISELLATRVPAFIERAKSIYNEYEPVGRKRGIPGWDEWSYRTRLNLAFIEKDFDFIEKALPPDGNRYGNFEISKRFYIALVHYERGGQKAIMQSIDEFRLLHNQYPNECSYLINLLAAYIKYFAEFDESEVVDSKSIMEARAYARELAGCLTEYATPQNILATVNILYLFIVLRNWDDYWSIFNSLPTPIKQQLSVNMTRLEVFVRRNLWQEARYLLEQIKVGNESNPEILRYINKIDEMDNSKLLVGEITYSPWNWQHFANALSQLATHPDPNIKAQAYFQSEECTYDKLLQILVLQSCQQVREYASYMIRDGQIADEDSYTKLFSLFVQEKLVRFGWNAVFQTHLGMTGTVAGSSRGGHGEPDLVISDNSGRLAICEAIRLKSINRQYTKSHIMKVRGYDPTDCLLYFQLIWCGASNWARVWDDYKALIRDMNTWNEGILPLIAIRSVEETDLSRFVSTIPHFESEHSTSHGSIPIRYLHVLVDVLSNDQQNAGIVASHL